MSPRRSHQAVSFIYVPAIRELQLERKENSKREREGRIEKEKLERKGSIALSFTAAAAARQRCIQPDADE